MTRLERKFRTDIEYKGCGGLNDAFDDAFKDGFRVNDDEYDYICSEATDKELDDILKPLKTFADKRQALIILNKLVLASRNSQ